MKPFPPHIDRMNVESLELSDRCKRLADFVKKNPTFDTETKALMCHQLRAMETYAYFLNRRLMKELDKLPPLGSDQ